MRFVATTIYVDDVDDTLDFFVKAFGFPVQRRSDSGQYGELATGDTLLAFSSHAAARGHIGVAYSKAQEGLPPLGLEIAFATGDVEGAVDRALRAGASIVREIETKPWGQQVAVVASPDNTLIFICTPM